MTAQGWPTEYEREALRRTPGLTAGLAFGLPSDVPLGVVYNSIFTALALPVARREREAAARAVRQAAEDLFWNGDTDCPMPGYDVLMDYAERHEQAQS